MRWNSHFICLQWQGFLKSELCYNAASSGLPQIEDQACCVCPQPTSASTNTSLFCVWANAWAKLYHLNFWALMRNRTDCCSTKHLQFKQNNWAGISDIKSSLELIRKLVFYGKVPIMVWELASTIYNHLKFSLSLSGRKVCLILPGKQHSEVWWHLIALGYWQAGSLPVLCFARKPFLCTEASE